MDDESEYASNRRGRLARRPGQIPLRGWYDILRRTGTRVMQVDLGIVAAGVAFYALLGLFPALTAVTALAGLYTDPGTIVFELDEVADILPPEAAKIVLDQANEVAGSTDGSLTFALIAGVAIALFAARRATMGLIHGLNLAYDEQETRGFFRKITVDIVLTGGVMLGGLVMLSLLVVLPAVLAFLPLGGEAEVVFEVLRWVVLVLVFVIGLAAIYRFGPARRNAKWRWLTPGAALAALLWFAGSIAFSYYVASFARYNETFGSLGGVIILLTWLWLSAFIVLIGATLDAEIEAQTARDSTVGPDRPMGERGATKADTLGRTF